LIWACALVVLVVLMSFGCRRLPSIKFESPFGHSNWVGIEGARVVEGSAPAIAVTISNRKNHPIWVRIEIEVIDGWNDCANSFKLTPGASHQYVCPQTAISAGTRYRAALVVYKDRGNTKPTEQLHRLIDVKEAENGSLVLEGRDAR
jgi:hypothetical protein